MPKAPLQVKGAPPLALDAPSLLSAVCHAGLVVPTPGILELPSLPFLHPFDHPPPLRFSMHRHRLLLSHTHRHGFLSPALCFPQHWAPSFQLGATFQHAARLVVPHLPFLVVVSLKGPSTLPVFMGQLIDIAPPNKNDDGRTQNKQEQLHQ